MRLIAFITGVALIAAGCNQKPSSSSENLHKPVPNIQAENLKGKVQKVETETCLIDSATGQKGSLESKSIEQYNDDGYEVTYSNYNAKDSSTTLTTFDIDANSFFKGMKTTKNDKPLSSMTAIVDSGKYTLATSYDSAGKVDVFYDDIVMNDFGHVVSATGHHADSSLKMTFTNNYDSIYYIGGESKDSVGKVTYSSTIQLNEKKDPQQMEETAIAKDSTTKTSTTYAYNTWDDKGNWTQQTITENGKPKKIIIRTITYKE